MSSILSLLMHQEETRKKKSIIAQKLLNYTTVNSELDYGEE